MRILGLAFLGLCLGGSAYSYPASVRDHFVQSCLAQNGEPATCGCVFDAIQARMPYADFERFDRQVADGEAVDPDLLETVHEARMSCQTQQDYSPPIEAHFLASCVRGGLSDTGCRCFYDVIRQELPFAAFMRADLLLTMRQEPGEAYWRVIDQAKSLCR